MGYLGLPALMGMKEEADMKTLAFVSIYYGLAWLYWNTYEGASMLASCGLFFFVSYFSFLGAVAVHNAIHCPVFHGKLGNKLFQIVLTMTYGHPVSNYVPGHNLSHHQNTQTNKDVMSTFKMRHSWHLLNGLFFFPKIGIQMLGNDAKYFAAQRKNQRPIYRQMHLEKVVLWTYLVVLGIINPIKLLVVIMAPHLIAKFCIISLNMLQHDGCDENSMYNHSRNFTGDFLNFFAYNNGYHTIHHMHPGWHWSKNKAMHEKLVKPHIHPNLDQASIMYYIFRTFIYPGIRIDYLGKPLVLPAEQPEEPWFYDSNETFSSKGDDMQ